MLISLFWIMDYGLWIVYLEKCLSFNPYFTVYCCLCDVGGEMHQVESHNTQIDMQKKES